MGRRILSFVLFFSLCTQAMAQEAPPPAPPAQAPGAAAPVEQRERGVNAGPRRQVATIVFAGLAGAVLGLSTLSFYGRPQDKLVNIPIGFAIGVIVGTVYVTYGAVTNPQEFYAQQRPWNEMEELRQQERFALKERPQSLGLKFSF